MIERMARRAGGLMGRFFRRVSRLRRAKSLHPRGTVRDATLTVHDNELFLAPGEHPALVRLSRGLGLPAAVPDVLGLAVRILDADQDLLLAGVGRDAAEQPYTTLLPYAAGGQRFVITAVPDDGGFELRVRGARLASLRLGPERAGAEPRFDPYAHTGAGLRPAGVLNRLRELAYPRSQQGWAS